MYRLSPLLAMSIAAAGALAGCLGDTTKNASTDLPDLGADLTAEPVVLEWSGAYMVGGAMEAPGHFPETAGLVEPVWREAMVNVDIAGDATDFRVDLTWTGIDASRVQIMVDGPMRDGKWNQWTTEFSSMKEQCLRIPADLIWEGTWFVMIHTQASAQLEYTLRATVTGAEASLRTDRGGWMPMAEYFGGSARGDLQEPEPAACE